MEKKKMKFLLSTCAWMCKRVSVHECTHEREEEYVWYRIRDNVHECTCISVREYTPMYTSRRVHKSNYKIQNSYGCK